MRKRYKIWMIIIIILLIVVSGIGVFKLFINKDEEEKPKNTTSIISNITDYEYTLDDRDTKYMKDEFEKLEAILKEDEVDYEAYATYVAKLFVIDFYTLNNKINKYDVGGLEYILSSKLDNFKNKAMDTIYNDVIDNTYKDRVQELPEITNVEVLNVEEVEIKLSNENTKAYKVTMKYTYRKDLGYDNEGTVYLVKNSNKLEIALYNPSIEENN